MNDKVIIRLQFRTTNPVSKNFQTAFLKIKKNVRNARNLFTVAFND